MIAVLSLACSSRSTTRSATPDAGGSSGTDSGSGGTAGGDAAVTCDAPSQCIQPPPSGWQGPIALYTGAPNTSPACPLDYPDPAFTAHGDPTGAPATCSACTCSSNQVSCSLSVIYKNAPCAGTPTTTSTQPIKAGECVALPTSVAPGSVTVSGFAAPTGTCAPSGGSASTDTPAWGTDVLGCSIAPPQCAGGVCVPEPSGGFEPNVCVWQEGDLGCPAGLYPKKRVFYKSFADTRGCTPCACAPMVGAQCADGTVGFYPKDGCVNAASPILALGSCTDADVSTTEALKLNGVSVKAGTCAESGGDPSGSVDGGDPITVCCR